MANLNLSDDIVLEVYDREDWLVSGSSNEYEVSGLDISFYRGHNMIPYRLAGDESPYIYAIAPDGKKQKLDITMRTDENDKYNTREIEKGLYHIVSQETGCYSLDNEGNYTAGSLLENPDAASATRYFKFAHTTALIGEDLCKESYAEIPLLPLQIASERWNGYKTGDSFTLTLYFEDRPLPLWDFEMFITSDTGAINKEELMTDGEGRTNIVMDIPGDYMIAVRYHSLERDDRLFFNTSYTYTYCFKVTDKDLAR